MPEPIAFPSAAKPRNRSIEARRAARVDKGLKERRIVDFLNRGVSIVEIAAREGVTEKRMRAAVKEILARRMPEAPADYAALQVGRLNEALLVAYSAMAETNLKAVECVVKIVREMDRYHGFVAAERRRGRRVEPKRRKSPAALADRLQTSLQLAEKVAATALDGRAPAAAVSTEDAGSPADAGSLRCARDDGRCARDDGRCARDDGRWARDDGRAAGDDGRLAGAGSFSPEFGADPADTCHNAAGTLMNYCLQTAQQVHDKTDGMADDSLGLGDRGAADPSSALAEVGLGGDPAGEAREETNAEAIGELAADGSLRSARDDGPVGPAGDGGPAGAAGDDSAGAPQNQRPQMAPQDPEKMEFAPGNDLRWGSLWHGRHSGDRGAAHSEAPLQGALETEPANRVQDGPDPFELAPVITVRTPTDSVGGFRLVKMRMVRNGVVACG